MVTRSSQEGRGMISESGRRALHMIYEITLAIRTSVFLGQRLLSPITSKFEIHVVSLFLCSLNAARRTLTSSVVHGSILPNLLRLYLSRQQVNERPTTY